MAGTGQVVAGATRIPQVARGSARRDKVAVAVHGTLASQGGTGR